jgi:hypothetical protein
MHSEQWDGELTRKRIGRQIDDLGNLENEALGIELGYRYDSSPVICHETNGTAPPRQTTDAYTPSTWPGARPPSVHLEDGTSLFDLLSGPGFTLLRFTDDADIDGFVAAAGQRGVPLEIVDVRDEHVRALYERDLVPSVPTSTSPGAATPHPATPSTSSTASAAHSERSTRWSLASGTSPSTSPTSTRPSTSSSRSSISPRPSASAERAT